jgi:hypothetical protein
MRSLFGWLVADGCCWFVLREEYCWLVAGGWFVLREKYCWLVADKPSEQAGEPHDLSHHVVLHTKLETDVIIKSHMNVICLQYRSLPLCRRSGLGAPVRRVR